MCSYLIEKIKYPLRNLFRKTGFDVIRFDPAQDPFTIIQRISNKQPVKVVFDVGAHIGQTTKEFLHYFPQADIYSFEPNLISFSELSRRFINSNNVKPSNLALGAYDGSAELFQNLESVTNSLLPAAVDDSTCLSKKMQKNLFSKSSSKVKLSRLDSFCQKNAINTIDLLKIDVQGYEDYVLDGASSMLVPSHIRYIFLEINFVPIYKGQIEFDKIFVRLTKKGYKFYDFFNKFSDPEKGILWTDALFVSG